MGSEAPIGDGTKRDLVLLVADANMEATVEGLLSRPESLQIREIDAFVIPHPERDPGCFLRAPDFLHAFRNRFHHALVMLDREGSGRDQDMSRIQMERDLEARLEDDWGNRGAAIVLDPELEIWLWNDSPHVQDVLGWKDRQPDLWAWLTEAGYLSEGSTKPRPPKEAAEKALRIARKARSSALYGQLARQVSLRGCEDPAFQRFCRIAQKWFPPTYLSNDKAAPAS